MDPLDVDLEDPELLGEVELTAALIIAANQTDRQLSATEIDAVLGLVTDPPVPAAAPTPAPSPQDPATAPPSEAPQPH